MRLTSNLDLKNHSQTTVVSLVALSGNCSVLRKFYSLRLVYMSKAKYKRSWHIQQTL